jgi:hypothetical protein
MAVTTGLEAATSAVTDPRWPVTDRNQEARIANFGALGALSNVIQMAAQAYSVRLADSHQITEAIARATVKSQIQNRPNL